MSADTREKKCKKDRHDNNGNKEEATGKGGGGKHEMSKQKKHTQYDQQDAVNHNDDLITQSDISHTIGLI